MTRYCIVDFWPAKITDHVKVLAKILFLLHTRLFNVLHGLIDRRQFTNSPRGRGDTYRRLPYKIDGDFIEKF